MATTYHNAIQQLYVAYFNRPADPAGLDFWETVLEANGGNTAVVSAEFAKSNEYTTEYSQVTTAGVVTQIYQNLFGHAPDSAGLAFWVKALNDKAMTVSNMVTEVAKGAQGTDKVAFDSKVTVAVAFTNALNTDAEKAGYNLPDAQEAAKELLATIKTAAQATAAIVPATLDASVAAVIKAGTPFTLESGLAALGAAQAAKAEFIEKFEDLGGTDDDADGDIDLADVEAFRDDITADIGTDFIDNAAFDTETNAGVRAAMIAAQVEKNQEDLEGLQETLDEAVEAVEEVDGLADAIAASTAAADDAEEAATVAVEADAAFGAAATSFEARNDDVTVNADGTATILVNGVAEDLIVNVDGVLELAEDFDAEDFTNLTAYLTAANAMLAAQAASASAADAALFAQLQVEILDQTAAPVLTFSETTPEDAADPTADEIVDEYNALVSVAVTARADYEAALAADPADPDLPTLLTAATDAETAASDFRADIVTYVGTNATALAQAVIDAQADVDTAQEEIDAFAEAVAEMEEAEALVAEYKSVDTAVKAALADITGADFKAPVMLKASAAGTTGSDIFVVNGVNSTITSFGRAGDDVLYVGEGYSLNDSGDIKEGDNDVLEVFFIQSGANTIVTIETETFGSNSADVEIKVTLTGVQADDLTFENGIITLG